MAQIFWQDDTTGILEAIDLPVVVMESHEDAVTITSHPVEQGANVSDHAREEPTRLMLEVFVSNMPDISDSDASFTRSVGISVPGFAEPGTRNVRLEIPTPPVQKSVSGLIHAGIDRIASDFGSQPKGTFRDQQRRKREQRTAQMLTQASPRDRVRDAYEKLLAAFQAKRLVTVLTEMREHFDMMIERVPGKRDAEDGLGATFSLEFQRIRVADSEIVQSPEPAEKRGQTQKSGGSKNPSADPQAPAKEEKRKTIAAGTTDEISA